MGAVASGGIRVMNDEVLRMAHVGETEVQQVVERETRELERRERVYRGERPSVNVTGRSAVVVDDGIATGSSMIAAIRSLRPRGATRIVVAVPVAPTETLHRLADEADEVVCVVAPEPFHAISLWYHAFPQLEDAEVRQALENASTRPD